jgi:hypothetical protein
MLKGSANYWGFEIMKETREFIGYQLPLLLVRTLYNLTVPTNPLYESGAR